MDAKKELPKRKKNRLQGYDYSSSGVYFITICTSERRNYFWNNVGARIARPQDVELSTYGEILDDAVKKISIIYPAISVEAYVIMPNHVHLLLLVRADEHGRAMRAPTMSRIVNQLKGYVTKKIGISIWQKLFFDHVIRNREDYEEHAKYIYENPMKWSGRFLHSDE